MSEIKWVKITTDMFNNRKIKYIRKLPEGNNIVLIWVALLTMAGRCNANGMIFLTENIPYTAQMIADEFNFKESTVELALSIFENLDMIFRSDDYFTIAGWEEYQNIEGMERVREQNKIRKRRQRERERLLITDNHVMSRDSHATEEDKDKEEEREYIDYKSIVDLYNRLCPSLPSVQSLSDARKKAIKARLNAYTIDDFKQLFVKAESSTFLKGGNSRNWIANFDWLIKDSNMAKVLDGNYDNKASKSGGSESHGYDFDSLEKELTRV